jgi:predicted Rossmann fold flavoprotein
MLKKLIIIGGGAAGFFCAVNAARMNGNLHVILIEKTGKILSKVKISGGGRCNVTHDCSSIAEMVKKYPRGANFIKKSFYHFFTSETVKWFEERGVILKTETDGRMFPVTDSSQTIIDCLSREVNRYGVEIMMNAEVKHIKSGAGKFEILLADSRQLNADFICVACGGYNKSIMFQWLTNLKHTIEEPVPSLFTFKILNNSITQLMGITVENVLVKIMGTRLEESGPLLITHWGMSGPSVLMLSAWGARELAERNYIFKVVINWLPEFNEQSLKDTLQEIRFQLASQKIINRNPFKLPQRLWEYFIEEAGIKPDIRWSDLPAKEQNKLVKKLSAGEFDVQGKTTFKEEFVTAGGINLSEVDPNTMMSKIVPDLFFAGEVLNIDGVTGGYNFQNAWTTGYIAAKAISEQV